MVYNIRVKVSDLAGRNLAVYRAKRGLQVEDALDKILLNLPAPEYESKKNKGE